jgi:hypothetical protein
MLNQESNALSEELGSQITYADFPYLANQVLAYSYDKASPTFYGVGKGGGALLWCEPTLQPDTPIHLDWAIKQPETSGPAWNNNIGNASELMCIASNQKTSNDTGTTIVVGGNNLISQGHQTNFAVCLDASLGGADSTFDTSLAVGGPSKSVNGIAYVDVDVDPYWICTGDDSLATVPTGITINDTNNQLVINVLDSAQDHVYVNSDLNFRLLVNLRSQSQLQTTSERVTISAGLYTRSAFTSELQTKLNFALNHFVIDTTDKLTPVTVLNCEFDYNGKLNIRATGLVQNLAGQRYTRNDNLIIANDDLGYDDNLNEFFGVDIDKTGAVFGVLYESFFTDPLTVVNEPWIVFAYTTDADVDILTIEPSVDFGVPEYDLIITIPPKKYNSSSVFATDVQALINTSLKASPPLAGYPVDLSFTYDSDNDLFVIQDLAVSPILTFSFNQYGEFQTPPRFALGKILGLYEGLLFTFDILAQSTSSIGYNLINYNSTWWSSDGLTWTPIKDPALQNVIGNSVTIINNNNSGLAAVVGTDDGVVYNDGLSLAGAPWTKLGSSTQLSGTNFGKVYAVASAPNSNDRAKIVVAIGCLGGQIYTNDDFWGTPTPTVDLLTTLLRSPNDYDPVCNSIKFTGNTDGNYPTWIFAGSSMSFITAVDSVLTGKTPTIVQFNSGPAQDPSVYPYLEYINGIETFIVDDGSPIVYTCLVGDNSGQYSCSDITSAPALNSWSGIRPFANNILIQIPVGYYTNTSLVSTIAELLNNQAVSGNGTFYTEVQADGTFVIANTTSGNWGIRFMNGTLTYEGTAALLGFGDVSKQYEPSVLQGQEGPYTLKSDVEGGITLTPFEYVLVQSDKFGNDLMTNAGLSAWWLVPNVANGVNANSIVYENTRNPTLEYLNNPRDIEQFDIRVLNSDGQVIELQDNKNVTLVIEFYTKKAGCR